MLKLNKTALRLPNTQYIPEAFPKDLVVIHHTVGSSSESTFDWLLADPKRIATAYLIDREGEVFELFPPECWAYHVGGDYGSRLERRSIGIELDCSGPLVKRGESFFAFADEARNVKGSRYSGSVFSLESSWRGWYHFAAYGPEQLASLHGLLRQLLVDFAIPAQTTESHDGFSRSLGGFSGVLGHSQLRADKTDPHPGLDWPTLAAECNLRR